MKRESSLADRAKRSLDICCQTLCDKELVEEYIKQLEVEVAHLRQDNENLEAKIKIIRDY
jgi:hypothetical protein